ncbi:MAG: hypothetical protein KJP08_08940 [Gammaproteobacteria bacterium]|nr:hypothetical protein [Gammaproteobacteria bacterium]MBT8106447.1 hypothetical protein [Gammaproteobacteria bacterium]NNF49338.1 hypothetical protein [Woeseiaceae bacterium]NNK26462.1 hypothetical protein [Woeseiaceae bacterium]NNL62624.1 hypothetical protein [Woeseiaceae bacterium]
MDPREKRHEFLPTLCFAMGVIFVLGAAYIGIGHAFTLGYAVIGITCMMAGTFMGAVRHVARAQVVRSHH